MGLRINFNEDAWTAHSALLLTNSRLSANLERLSTGYRINRASDDAAGLAISEKLRYQISGLDVAIRNTNESINLLQTADSALDEISRMLREMRDLALHARNIGATDPVAAMQDNKRIAEGINAINQIAARSRFGDIMLLNGTMSSGTGIFTFQVGAFTTDVQSITISCANATMLGIPTLLVTGFTLATLAINSLTNAISQVSQLRGTIGSFISNNLQSTLADITTQRQNIASSESYIRNVDMAAEILQLTRNQILQQSGVAMLLQANLSSQNLLSLLK